MPRPRFTPSPATVIACAALLVALGGTSIAAVSVALPRNSVGPAQLKNNSVTSIKVANRSLRAIDFELGQLPAGPRGPAGPPGPAGPAGAAGATGFPAELPSGKTLRGTFAGRAYAPAAGQDMQIPITFAFPFSDAPTTHYIPSGGVAPSACPGTATTPQAEPGNLCVYESAPALNATGRVFDPIGGADDTATTYGAGVSATAKAAGDFRVRGSWAVTAR
jgi:hypothetical protein